MSVTLEALPFFVACLAAVAASAAAAQETNGAIRPAAATPAARIDSIVAVDVLAPGMPIVSVTAALALELADRGRLSLGASPFAERRPPRIAGSSHPRNGIA